MKCDILQINQTWIDHANDDILNEFGFLLEASWLLVADITKNDVPAPGRLHLVQSVRLHEDDSIQA